MRADTIECWLCEATLPPDAALVCYRDQHGMVHPWPDGQGRWQEEYICRACALVCPDDPAYDWSGATTVAH